MTAIFLIVAEVIPYKPGEMPFAKDDDVLEELSTAAADPALGGSVWLYRRLHSIRALHQNVFESPIRSTRM